MRSSRCGEDEDEDEGEVQVCRALRTGSSLSEAVAGTPTQQAVCMYTVDAEWRGSLQPGSYRSHRLLQPRPGIKTVSSIREHLFRE